MQGRFAVLQQEIKKLKHCDKEAAQANDSLHGELMKLEESKKVLLLRLQDSNQNLASKRHDNPVCRVLWSSAQRPGQEMKRPWILPSRVGLASKKQRQSQFKRHFPLSTNGTAKAASSGVRGKARLDLISGANPTGVSPEGESSKEQNSHEQRESLSVHQEAKDLGIVGDDANDLNLKQENMRMREGDADGLNLNEGGADDLGIFEDDADGLNLNEGDADDLGIFEDDADGLNLNEGDGLNLNEGDADDLEAFSKMMQMVSIWMKEMQTI